MGDERQPTDSQGQAGEYATPQLECDIVMKGGVTSGVVYPGAVLELAKRYRFRSIGGTSAGAIAAAVVAAAEHNRAKGGFDRVDALRRDLAEEKDGKTLMLRLFAPDARMRALFESLTGFMLLGKFRAILNACRLFWRAVAPPVAIVVAAILVTAFAGADAVYVVAAVLAAVLLLLVGLLTEGILAIRALGENDFGICHLGPEAGTADDPALTPWLYEQIQLAAGRTKDGPSLTFADLWGVEPLPPGASDEQRRRRAEEIGRRSREADERAIDLQMITTSLTHGRPMRLPIPFRKHEDVLEEGDGLLFDPEEMKRYFPDEVVAHLVEFGAAPDPETTLPHLEREAPGRGFRHFPIGADLPVVVAARMSLSFPVAIAAVTLWELDRDANPAEPPLKRVVFTDGGMTSNFPIHLFDGPLPRRPTFGLQFVGFERGDGPRRDDPAHSIADPPPVDEERRAIGQDIDGLAAFLSAIKDGMQNWRDNVQSQMPGYRDRIVQIKMDRGEGGFNLAMKTDKLNELSERGAVAGEHLVSLFSGPPGSAPVATKHLEGHRFARYRVTMSVLEGLLRSYRKAYRQRTPPATPWEERIEQGLQPPFEFEGPAELDAAQTATVAYMQLADASDQQSLDDANVPRPPASLRSVPRS